MDQEAIRRFVAETYDGVDVEVAAQENGAPEVAWGDTFFIHDPEHNLEGARRFPFATIVTQDYGDFDNRSNLDRPGVFRLNIGIGRDSFVALFGSGDEGYDFTALDRLMPHPVYGGNHWVCVLNPSETTFESLRPLLDEAYSIAVKRNRRGG
jgi:hypothetical protein